VKHVLIGVVIVLLLSASSAQAQDLIANGGFEETTKTPFKTTLSKLEKSFYPGMKDTPAAGWVFGGGWDGGRYTVHLSDEAHTGKHAIEMRAEKKGRGGIAAAPFKVAPGTILKVSFWVKAKGAEGGTIVLNYEGTPGDGWNRKLVTGGTFDWKKITKRCVVPVRHCRADGQTIALFIYSKAPGSVWIDDVTVETVDVNKLAESPSAPALTPPKPKDIPEPVGSIGYRIDTASALVKVLPDTDFAPTTKGGENLSLPSMPDRLLETTLLLDAVANVADARPDTREGPTDILPGDGISSAAAVLVRPRGGAMLSSRQRAERQIRGVIRRLR